MLNILVVGNSFSSNATAFLPQAIQSAPHGDRAEITHASLSGCSIRRHLEYARKYADNPDAPEGSPYGCDGEKKSLQGMLRLKPWDIVTIQQASAESWKPETFLPEARELVGIIRKHAPTAEVVMHQTWAYRADDPYLPKNGMTDVEMHQKARDAYRAAAAELGLRLIPVGEAFRRALDDPEWACRLDADFDRIQAVSGQLPGDKRGLHVGYHWRQNSDGVDELHYDGAHANTFGRYLGALVWHGFFFGRDPGSASFAPDGVDPGEAAILRRIAGETLGSTPAVWR